MRNSEQWTMHASHSHSCQFLCTAGSSYDLLEPLLMEDTTLIVLVRNYEELYNTSHRDYRNQPRRDGIWEEIGRIMKRPGSACKERWTRLRDNYRKAITLRKTKIEQGATNIKAPKFAKELKFLDPYVTDEDPRYATMSSPDVSEDAESILGYIKAEVLEDQPSNASERPPSVASSTSSSKRRRISSVSAPSEEPSAVPILKPRQTKETKTVIEDPLVNFFLNMAETVRTFPLRDQVEIKAKVFQIVNSVEMRIATEQTETDQSAYMYASPSDRYSFDPRK